MLALTIFARKRIEKCLFTHDLPRDVVDGEIVDYIQLIFDLATKARTPSFVTCQESCEYLSKEESFNRPITKSSISVANRFTSHTGD